VATDAPPAVVIVVGPEELLADRAVGAVVQQVRAVDADADVRYLQASGLEAGTVTELTSPSLFGERKAIVVRDVQEASDALLAELKARVAEPAPDVTLALTHKGVSRGGAVLQVAREHGAREIPCAAVKTRRDRLAFLSAEFAARRRRATPDAVDLLLDAVGGDLRGLASAVRQLCADTTGLVDAESVGLYYGGRAEVTGFTVADRAVEGRADEALLQLRYALGSGTDPVPIVAALAAALRAVVRMASAPRGLRDVDLARELGMAPWKVRTVRDQMRGWDAERMAVAVAAVARADEAVKGGSADPVFALERAVVTVARARGGR
jgi:DNA polymerase III subunit delta